MDISERIDRIRESAPTTFVEREALQKELYVLYMLYRNGWVTFSELRGNKYLTRCIRFLRRLVDRAIIDISNEEQYLLYISIYIMNRFEVLEYFLLNDFIRINPLNSKVIDVLKDRYSQTLKTTLTCYFNSRLGMSTMGSSSLTEQTSRSYCSSRYGMYQRCIKYSQIQLICNSSDKLRQIYNNLKQLSDELTINELQRLYSSFIQNDHTEDAKLLILKFNVDNEQMSKIRLRMPLIYKLLKSARLKRYNVTFTHYEKLLLRDVIREKVNSQLTKLLTGVNAAIISEAISIKVESSITEGVFIDPYTLEIVDIKGSLFIEQLSEYLQFLTANVSSFAN